MAIVWFIALAAFIIFMIVDDRKIKKTESYQVAKAKGTKPPRKLLTRRWWSWALIVFFIIAWFVAVGSEADQDERTDRAESHQTQKAAKKAKKPHKKVKASPRKTPKKKAAPKVVKEKDYDFYDKNPGRAVTLGAGKYYVGQDIKPGRYVIRAVRGSGNLSDADATINVILGPSVGDDELSSFTTNLLKGDKISIEGIEATSFTPTPSKYTYQNVLGAGFWMVGRDIKPGRYVISGLRGSGNLISSENDDGDTINEMLSATPDEYYVTKVTAELTEGQIIESTLESIKLTRK